MKKKMKKMVSLCLLSALLGTTLAGCGGSGSESSPASAEGSETAASSEKAESDSGDKVSLSMAIWGDEARAEAYQKTLEPFCEENNCTVKIELVPIADFFDKLASQLGAGTAPDIFWLADAKEATFIQGGWCANLKDALTSDPEYNFDDFYTDAIMSTDYGDGGIYGVPFSFGARAIFYNKTMFENAGLKTPDEYVAEGNWTYETMFDLASKLKAADSTKVGLKLWCVGQATNGVQNFADILAAYGANLLNEDSTEFILDSPEGIQVTQMVYDSMYKDGGHAKPGDDVAFVSGNVGMARECYSYMKSMVEGNVDFEWGIVPQPYGSKGTDGELYTGYAYWCANETSENKDLAIELIKFISNPENQLAWCSTFMPPRTSVLESDEILNPGEGYPAAEDIQASFVDCVNERGLFSYRGTSEWNLLSNAVEQGYEMIWSGAYTVEDGVAEMKTAVESYLNH